MASSDLPGVISVQDNLAQTIGAEEASLMVTDFLKGSSLRDLARDFLPIHEEGVATNAINQILKDIIPPDEYEALIKGKGAKKQLKLGIGIHGKTLAERQAAGKMGAKKSGANVYSEAESTRLVELVLDPENKLGTRINASKIADVLNEEFHQGEAIRTSENVRKHISRNRERILVALV